MHRFALIPPRVRFGLRLAHLVGMTEKAHTRKSTALRVKVIRYNIPLLLTIRSGPLRCSHLAHLVGLAVDKDEPLQAEQHRPERISHFVHGQSDAATMPGEYIFEMELQQALERALLMLPCFALLI
jgi:hypothetical protein